MRIMICILSIYCFASLLLTIAAAEGKEITEAKQLHDSQIQKLDDALQQARRKHMRGVADAYKELIAVYDNAILRGLDDGDKELVVELRKTRQELAAKVPKPFDSFADELAYECVLGVYGRSMRAAQYPFVNLRPPNRDLWTKEIHAKVNGRFPVERIEYIGTAKIVVPQDGWYTIDVEKGTLFRLNGTLLNASDVELLQGVYDVEIHAHTWGQPYMFYARANVLRKETKERLPFVNTGSAIESFLSQKINGRAVEEVSGYVPKEVDIKIE